MAEKAIRLKSGAIIYRIPVGTYDEDWEIDNWIQKRTSVHLNLSNWEGITVLGHEYETNITESAEPFERKTIFKILKDPPFRFKISYSATEEEVYASKLK